MARIHRVLAKIIAALMLFGTTKPLTTIILEPSPIPYLETSMTMA